MISFSIHVLSGPNLDWKGKWNAALIFMNTQRFLWLFLSSFTSTYILPLRVSHLQPATLQYLALLVDTWCYSATYWVELGQTLSCFAVVLDEETHCWRTSAIKCTLSVQRPFNMGHHTADLDIKFSYYLIIRRTVLVFTSGRSIKSFTLWATVLQSHIEHYL